jgi:hypothetical protein
MFACQRPTLREHALRSPTAATLCPLFVEYARVPVSVGVADVSNVATEMPVALRQAQFGFVSAVCAIV